MDLTRRAVLGGAAGMLALACGGRGARAGDGLPVLRVGTLENGTVNWELTVIRDRGLDRQNGFSLQPLALAGNPAIQVALLGGEVDAIVTDWLWAARQRADGTPMSFLPYSTAVGGLMVPADSPARTVSDLRGRRIGIAGGPLDKSWLILRAWSRRETGEDLAAITTQVYGAPPMILNAARTGEVDAAINFWHFQARMAAEGMRELVSVATAAAGLGLDPATPLLGYVLRDDWIAAHPGVARGLARASSSAKQVLAQDDAAWQALRPLMQAEDPRLFEALKAGWRAGIPPAGPVDPASAQRMFETMAALGGDELTGGLRRLPEGLFPDPERLP